MPIGQLPKYEQVKRSLIAEIEQGRWTTGGTIPSEAQLLRRFNVSRPTLVRSLQDLVREGYLHRRQGKGTFVAERNQRDNNHKAQGTIPVFTSSYWSSETVSVSEVLVRLLRGIQAALGPAHIDLSLRYAAAGAIDGETRRFLEAAEPGVALVVEPSFSSPLLHELTSRGWTVWALNEPWPEGNAVYIDQERSGYLACKYLIEKKGCRHIALLNGPRDAYWGFAAKTRGYQTALLEAGISMDPKLICEGEHIIDMEAGRAMMRGLLQEGLEIDGVVGVSDAKAIGAVAAAQDAGRRVPDDLPVIGIDDILAGSTIPPIPAVALPFEEVGRCAAEEALRRNIDGHNRRFTHVEIKLKPTLIER